MPPEELESSGLVAGQLPQVFEDPFSMEFMEQAERTIEVSASTAPRVRKARKVLTDKFVMHKDLKKRLLKLKSSNVPQIVKDIVDDLMSLKRVPEGSKYCNYLGLSQADYSKLSYLDEERKNRLEGQSTTMHMIRPGTIVKIHRALLRTDRSSIGPFRTQSLTLTSRHLNGAVYPIKETYLQSGSHIYSCYGESEMIEVPYAYTVPRLENEANVFRIRNSRTYGAGAFFIDQLGMHTLTNYPKVIGVEFENTEITLLEVWNFKKRYHTSVGKLIRRLFKDKYSDRDITSFSEAYASLVTVANPMYDFEIIEGDDIRWAYHEDNYYTHSNTLGSSCMRYERCQKYFEIYTRDPSKVKMGVLKRGRKVAARCILWKLDSGWAYDRIYSTRQETENLLKTALEEANYTRIWQTSGDYRLELDLDGVDYFPYVDSLFYYHPDTKILSNRIEGPHYTLRSTGGDYSDNTGNDDMVECVVCGDEVDFDNSYYIDEGRHRGERTCNCCYIYSERTDGYFTVNDEYEGDYNGDNILSHQAVRLRNGEFAHEDDDDLREYENGYGYFIVDLHKSKEIDGKFYHPDDTDIPEKDTDEETVEEVSENVSEPIMPTSILSETNSSSTLTYTTSVPSGSYSYFQPYESSYYTSIISDAANFISSSSIASVENIENDALEELRTSLRSLAFTDPTESQEHQAPDESPA